MHPIIDINTYLALPITNTILLDCRFTLGLPDKGREDFNRGHIPNAQHIDLEKDLSGPIQLHGGRHPLPSIEDIENTFQRLGVNGDSQVVLYDDKNMAYAARAWWILKYIGHDNVLIIDGGISEWIRQKHPLSTETITLPKGNLIASPNAQMLVFREDVIHSNNILLIDSRAPDRYSGAVEPLDKVAGHIPNAINMFWMENYEEDGTIKPEKALSERWNQLPNDKDWIVYCGSGVTACANILSMYIAGFETMKLYPGSWSDWCSYPLDSTWAALKE